MRKFTLISLVVIFAMILGACQPAAAPTEAPKQEAPKQEAPKEEVKPTEAPAAAGGEKVTITIESWRNDDLKIWADSIIPAFEKSHPNIHVVFQPSAPAEYNGILNTKLEGGAAGDLITCRPFDASLKLFDKGYLAPLTDLKGMENFGDVAKSAWITDDGKTVFCVPMASVIHGFFYNKDAFAKVGVEAPKTVDQFFKVLEAIKKDGTYAPIGMGTADLWESATMGFQNIGPNYWMGEEGRKALLAGTGKYTDAPYVETWKQLAAWKPYLPEGFEAVKYPDAQVLFTSGKAAIYPTGSWEISGFEDQVKDSFKMGIFLPPVQKEGDTCYISDHTDIAMGMNAASKHPAETKAFLEWMTSQEFAELYSNALPGFFTLSNYKITLKDPLANEFLGWRGQCKSTIRNSYQILSRGEPNLENELWRVSAAVINGTLTPEQAAKEIQDGMDKWYKPAGGAAAAPAAGAGGKIGLSFSDFATERWKNEATLMEKLLKDKGYEVMIQEANHDVKLQNDQIDNMVAQGAKALIVIAEDGDAAVTAVDKAAQAGVKVIAYDRLIKSPNIAAYISFDNVEVGRQQAAGVLKALDIDNRKDPVKLVKLGGSPTDNNAILFRKGQDEMLQKYVDSKKIEVVADQWVDNWDPANALKLMENVLTAAGNKVDAVVASNDGTALGALQAMKAQKLAGVVPISGQDATADGCNSIVKGELTVTIFKDIRKLSPLATDLADKLLKGETVDGLKKFTMAELTNDPAKTGDVMAFFLPVVQVTKENVYDEIVKSAFQSYDDVYRDIPEDQRPPKPEAGGAAPAEKPAAGAVEPGVGGKVVMMPKSSGNAYFEKGTRVGGEEAIKELGYELVYTASEKSEASQQIQIIDAAAAQKPKALVVSATDPKAICPPLKKAMAAGIKVVTYDADAPECRDAFALQANAEGIGRGQVQIICDLLGGADKCEGEIAILSATATAPNQNEWIKWMNEELKDAKYGKLKLVATVYGDDLDQKSYDEALGLFKSYPNLKGIISPTSVGVVAAARAITDKSLIGKIQLTGLGVPSQLKEFVKSGACPKFALWNPVDLGYLAIFTADALLKGKGKEGDKFTAGRLGEYTFGKDGVVLLGPPFVFDKDNVDKFGF